MRPSEDGFCPTLRPTRAAFERPFCHFVREVFAKNPDLPCFKVIPPKGWTPRKGGVDLDNLRIKTPIKQHVFGKSGAYMCILEEQRGMSAADFKRLAARPEHQPPPRGHRDDSLCERAFWSSVTNSPPLYGADTPVSLFDARLAWGWNLRNLGCMLQDKRYDVPQIPGVTTPMSYFGMYKAFFGWHKEDVDLYSINYLHFGAPKVWYCVSPRDNPRFEAMARALFPDLHRACHGFMRHKDILISPRLLKQYNVPYVRARQEAGEFIVLNAAAYHAGFNLGFNCAEAINFALEEWLEAGKAAVACTCSALPEGVQLDMGIFCPELREEEGSSEEEEEEEEEGSSSDEEEEGEEEQPGSRSTAAAAGRKAATAKAAAAKTRGRAKEAPAAAAKKAAPGNRVAAAKRTSDAKQAHAGGRGKRRALASQGEESDSEVKQSAAKRQRSAPRPPAVPKLPDIAQGARASRMPREAAHAQWGKVAEEQPLAVVERDEHTRQPRFSLVHRLAKPSSKPGSMWVGLLQEGPDGLYRPQSNARLLTLGSQYPRVARVRTEWVSSESSRRGGWALKTKRERILM